MDYSDKSTEFMSPAEASTVAGLAEGLLDDFSYGKLQASITVYPDVIRMPHETSCYAPPRENAAVRLYADIREHLLNTPDGIDISQAYDRLIIVSYQVWGGVGAVAAPRIVLYGPNENVPLRRAHTWVHELGHTYNLRHADLWLVWNAGDPPDDDGCSRGYADHLDTMGGTRHGAPPSVETPCKANRIEKVNGHFGPWYKHRLGWLEKFDDIVEVTGPLPDDCISPLPSEVIDIASLDVAPKSAGGSNNLPSAIRLPVEAGKDLWIYYRGYESEVEDGVSLQWGWRQNYVKTKLLDMETAGASWGITDDAHLRLNEPPFTDITGSYSIEVTDIDPNHTSAQVCISEVGTLPSPDVRPIIDITSPNFAEIQAGQVTYTATAYDPDVGTTNGAGVGQVVLDVYSGSPDDAYACVRSSLDATSCPFLCPGMMLVHTATFSDPGQLGYTTTFDSTMVSDGGYFLVAWTADSESCFPTNVAMLHHLIDNTGSPWTPVCGETGKSPDLRAAPSRP